jgi:hypothetical protein
VERAAAEGGKTLISEGGAAVEEPSILGAELQGAGWDRVDIRLVRLAQVSGVGDGQGTLLAHPHEGGGGVQTPREGEPNPLTGGQRAKETGHEQASS